MLPPIGTTLDIFLSFSGHKSHIMFVKAFVKPRLLLFSDYLKPFHSKSQVYDLLNFDLLDLC